MKKTIINLSIFMCALYGSYASAEDITLITEDTPAEAEKVNQTTISGIGGDIVTKALKAKNITFKIEWTLWKRAQADTIKNEDKKTFIIPLTRNKEREDSYNWTAKIYDSDTAFLTLKSEKKINSLKEANGKKIGVLFGSSYEGTITHVSSGIDKSEVDLVNSDTTNARKLEKNRIAAWYTGVIGAFAILRAEKMDTNLFQAGKTIEREEIYIATAKSTPEALIKRVRDAIEDFKKTPEYEATVAKYTK